MELGFAGAAPSPTTIAAVAGAATGQGGTPPAGAKELFLKMMAANQPAAESPLAATPVMAMLPLVDQPGQVIPGIVPSMSAITDPETTMKAPVEGDPGEPGEPALDSVLTIPILGAPVAALPVQLPAPVPLPLPVVPVIAPSPAPSAPVGVVAATSSAPAGAVAAASPASWIGKATSDMSAPTPIASPAATGPLAVPLPPAVASSDPAQPTSATPAGVIASPIASPAPRPRAPGLARVLPIGGEVPQPDAATLPASPELATQPPLFPVADNLPADEGRATAAPVSPEPDVAPADPGHIIAAPNDPARVGVAVASDQGLPQPSGGAAGDPPNAGQAPAIVVVTSPPPERSALSGVEQPPVTMPRAPMDAAPATAPALPDAKPEPAPGDRSPRPSDPPLAPAIGTRAAHPVPPVGDQPVTPAGDGGSQTDGDRFVPAVEVSPVGAGPSAPLDLAGSAAAPILASMPEAPVVAGPNMAEVAVTRQLTMAQDGQWLDQLARDIVRTAARDGELRFQLNPEHLGSLAVEMRQTADGTSLRFSADTEAARAIIADAQPRLIAEAKAQGVQISEAKVDVGGGRADTQGRQPQQQQQSQATGRTAEPQRQNRSSVTVETPSSATSERYA